MVENLKKKSMSVAPGARTRGAITRGKVSVERKLKIRTSYKEHSILGKVTLRAEDVRGDSHQELKGSPYQRGASASQMMPEGEKALGAGKNLYSDAKKTNGKEKL